MNEWVLVGSATLAVISVGGIGIILLMVAMGKIQA
jgi:hypothetical protein